MAREVLMRAPLEMTDSDLEGLKLGTMEAALSGNWADWFGEVRRVFHVDSVGCDALTPSPFRKISHSAGVRREAAASYVQYYGSIDPFHYAILRLPTMRAYTEDQLVPRSVLSRSEYFTDYAVPNGIHHLLAIGIEVEGDDGWCFGMTREKGREFGPADVEALEIIAKYLRNALRFEHEVRWRAAENDVYAATLARINVPIVVADLDLSIGFLNPAAEQFLATTQIARRENGGLRISDGAARIALSQGVNRALCGEENAFVSFLVGNTQPVKAIVARGPHHQRSDVFSHEIDTNKVAIFFLARDWALGLEDQDFVTVFGFTRKEAAAARLLVCGAGIEDVARSMGLTREGARHYLKTLFAKTGVHTQRELVHTLSTLVGSLRGLSAPVS
jgi:DNA-binding CsgD family transcriptional regulator